MVVVVVGYLATVSLSSVEGSQQNQTVNRVDRDRDITVSQCQIVRVSENSIDKLTILIKVDSAPLRLCAERDFWLKVTDGPQ